MSDERPASKTASRPKRLAIIGGGSSGLICLKYALDFLDGWEITCFEQSDRITGAWGNPYPGFVSTSTKYTTQFACYTPYDASVRPDGGASRSEFFRDGEYGQYLEDFAAAFSLSQHIQLRCRVESTRRAAGGVGWELTFRRTDEERSEAVQDRFDAVVICTGLASEPKQVDSEVKTLSIAELTRSGGLEHVVNQRIVVMGGGESAVDYANRLARPELGNQVFLSLQSGIRVSPRYHPIRGVPSDFLRNRLMLSIHEDIRNWIGQRFVELRIRYQERFEWLFPRASARHQPVSDLDTDSVARRKDWAFRLTKAAKDDLFNMFHNKSDDFLDAVAEERITIVGKPIDRELTRFHRFDTDGEEAVNADLVVPAIGYRANLPELSSGEVRLADFYLGCCHITFPDLYLVGFARPIIGNIPSMSEMQARYVCGLIAGRFPRPANLAELHREDLAKRKVRYAKLDLDALFPVEMFPYCDRLASLMNSFPSLRAVGSVRAWWRMQLSPATTIHYRLGESAASDSLESSPIYMPPLLVAFLLALKPLDWVYRLMRIGGILPP